ncbi:hypothetical protein FQN53_000233 [Emmonsiellopsis sp. PD_33]|nr:hypothetical protein FQN53_000233 [Emmonsiellopsis sp. PD_33]
MFRIQQTEHVGEVEKAFNYVFNDPSSVHKALQLPGSQLGGDNRALAQLGDFVLRLSLAEEGYVKGKSRAHVDSILQQLATIGKAAEIGFLYSLDRVIYKNPSQLGAISPKSMAATVHALVGAIYLDSGKDINRVKVALQAVTLAWPESST